MKYWWDTERGNNMMLIYAALEHEISRAKILHDKGDIWLTDEEYDSKKRELECLLKKHPGAVKDYENEVERCRRLA